MSDGESTQERFSAVMRLLGEALDRPDEERESWLRGRHDEDPEVLQEVVELLAAHEDDAPLPRVWSLETTAPLDGLGPPRSRGFRQATAEGVSPEWIGRYRILERIAEGGMGSVFKAEQREPMRRLVAVKVIRPGMDSQDVLHRFDAERQALALMDHPNIARVFDGGLDAAGRPFFAMEYVAGESLVSFCDRRRLALRARLELFVKVCAAVQHAHQKGVIHRDLKPSNVLVSDGDDGPVPKVIDFGIAKAIDRRLTNATLMTAHGLLLGTPEYMSPEQAGSEADDLDTRTDVFSLGVLLYQLLVGCLPFDRDALQRAGLGEVLRTLREEDPPQPSTRLRGLGAEERATVSASRVSTEAHLVRELERDLDWVVMRALEKDRRRRYPSVSEFAAEIDRYLTGEPVLAGPPSLRYRASKFVRRHRLAVSAALALATVVSLALVVLGVQSARLRTALEESEQQARRAGSVSRVLVDAFRSADPLQRTIDREVTAAEVLDRAAEALETQELSASDRAWLAGAMGSAFLGIHELDRAESLLDGAVAPIAGQDPAALAEARSTRALLYAARSSFDAALAEAEAAVELADSSGGARQRLVGRLAVATALNELGRFDDARDVLEKATAIARRAPAIEASLHAQVELARAQNAHQRADYEEALELGRRAVEFAERAWSNPLRHLESRTLWMRALFETGERRRALEIAEQDHATALDRLGPEHPRTVALRNAFALQLNQSPRIEEALALHLENVALARRLDPGGARLPSLMNNLGLTQLGLGLLEEAEATNREALRLQIELVGDDHPNVGYHRMNLARVLHAQRRYREAEPEYRAANDLWTRRLPEGHTLRGNVAVWLGALLVETERAGEGLALLEEGRRIREADRGGEDWQTAEARSWYGAALAELGQLEEARRLLEESHATIAEQRGTYWLRTRWSLARVLYLLQLEGDSEALEAWSLRWQRLYGEPPQLDGMHRWALP